MLAIFVSVGGVDFRVSAGELGRLTAFRNVAPKDLREVARRLEVGRFDAGQLIYSEGDRGENFVIVLHGEVSVTRDAPDGQRQVLAVGAPGSIFGELSMLTGARRRASLRAATATTVAAGTAEAFRRILDIEALHHELMELAAQRLAELAALRAIRLGDGTEVAIRPLLATDRSDFASALQRQSADWRRSRFFTPTNPSRSLIDYLVHIDYVHHFAWVVVQPEAHEGVGVGRYVTLDAESAVADLAFEVDERWRGRGVATRLLGALGVAACEAGLSEFQADVLVDNAAMRAVFDKAGAKWTLREPGVMTTRFAVDAASELLDEATRVALCSVASEIVTGAGLALRATPPDRRDDDEHDAGDQQDRTHSDPAEQSHGQIRR